MNDQNYVDDIAMAFKKGELAALDKVLKRLDQALTDLDDDFEMAEGVDLAIRIVKTLK